MRCWSRLGPKDPDVDAPGPVRRLLQFPGYIRCFRTKPKSFAAVRLPPQSGLKTNERLYPHQNLRSTFSIVSGEGTFTRSGSIAICTANGGSA